jgi:CRP-like cAMP-binding protein
MCLCVKILIMQYQLPFFENLCPSWRSIASLGVRRAYPKGCEILGLENPPVDGVYFIDEGTVEIMLYTSRGPEKVLFYAGPGCIFGEISCFAAGDRETEEANVLARSDCVVYFFSREQVEGIIAKQYPHLLIELIRASAVKIKMFVVLLQDSLNSDNFMRVCKMLVYLVRFKLGESGADPQAANLQREIIIRPDLNQNDLARLLGIHRVTVTKSISRLKRMGLLGHFSKKTLKIVDYPALLQLVESADL